MSKHTWQSSRRWHDPEAERPGSLDMLDRDGEDLGRAGPRQHGSPYNGAPVAAAGALSRYRVLVLIPLVALAAAGVALGLRQPATFTASSEINVGSLNVNAQATPGYVVAEQTLASAYSRVVDSTQIAAAVGKRLHVSEAAALARLSSSAVPSSPTFYINATGPSQATAVAAVHAATGALVRLINVVDQGTGASSGLLQRYRQAQATADQLTIQSNTLAARRATGDNVSSSSLQAVKLSAQVAALKAATIAQQYSSSATSTPGPVIDVLEPATSASSNRASLTERYGVIGALSGLVIGVVFALLADRVRGRRRRSALA